MTITKAVITKRMAQKSDINFLGTAGRVEKAAEIPQSIAVAPPEVAIPTPAAEKSKRTRKSK